MTYTPLEERVLERITEADLVELTSELVRFASVDGQESPVQRHIADYLGSMGCEMDVWDLDFAALSLHPAFSMEIDRREGIGVVGTIGAGEGPTLILNGHVDVVPAGPLDLWTTPPYQPVAANGFVRGRGALDMKGGLACALVAAKAVRAAGVTLRGRLHVASVIGEEDGGVGTLGLIERGYRGDGAVVMEPTRLQVVTAQAGCHNFRVKITGRAAHGALRTEGVSAIEFVAPILDALRDLESRRSEVPGPGFAEYEVAFPISVGRLEAGTWASSVPEEAVMEGRYGLRVGEDPTDARAQLEQAVAAVCRADPWLRENPAVVEWWGGRFDSARTPPDAGIVATVRAAHDDQRVGATATGAVPYGADMGLLVNHGHTPTVLYGPGDVRQAHTPDEAVPVGDLVICARSLALTILRFCGVEG